MNKIFLALVLPFFFFSGIKAEGLQSGDLVAICGDSITEQKLYSLYIEQYLLMCQPAPQLQTMQFGWSGEKADGFLSRMRNDTLSFKPTVATTCYGMNDGGYKALTPETEKKYRENMEGILKTFKESGVRFVVVGSPGAMDTNRQEALVYNETLGALGQAAKEVAQANGAAFADVHTPMIEVMAKAKAKYGQAYHVAGGDGVHPAPNGHMIMAYAFLKALGCSGEIGTITVDQKAGTARATEGHEVVSSVAGKVEIKSSRYPFCFSGDPANPQSTSGIIEFFPFNQDLNRFVLVVVNASAPKLKVTWGEESKVYEAAELEKGINLASEFLKNPFSKPFEDVTAQLRKQQNFETFAIKGTLHSLLGWNQTVENSDPAYAKILETISQKSQELRQASASAVMPVNHVITIEAAP